jgi:hypothetical protein
MCAAAPTAALGADDGARGLNDDGLIGMAQQLPQQNHIPG